MNRNEEDGVWKDILDYYLKDFLDYCLPDLSELIDWTKKWTPLDKELQMIMKDNKSGKQLLDKLYQVHLKDGRLQWILVLIHVEVQGRFEEEFPERMFRYSYRSYDKYKIPIVSLAILTDKNHQWRPDSFEVGLAGSYLKSKFLTIKVIDYKTKKDELSVSKNPFAIVLLCQLIAIESKHRRADDRKKIKSELIRRLYKIGLNKENVYNILRFIDSLIGLPQHLEVEFRNEIYEIEKENKMAYVTSFERIVTEKGVEIGIEKKARVVAQKMLHKGMPMDVIVELTDLTKEEIQLLQEELTV